MTKVHKLIAGSLLVGSLAGGRTVRHCMNVPPTRGDAMVAAPAPCSGGIVTRADTGSGA